MAPPGDLEETIGLVEKQVRRHKNTRRLTSELRRRRDQFARKRIAQLRRLDFIIITNTGVITSHSSHKDLYDTLNILLRSMYHTCEPLFPTLIKSAPRSGPSSSQFQHGLTDGLLITNTQVRDSRLRRCEHGIIRLMRDYTKRSSHRDVPSRHIPSLRDRPVR